MKGMQWAHSLVGGYSDSIDEWGQPDFDLIREVEGERPTDELVMALDWIAMEPMLS